VLPIADTLQVWPKEDKRDQQANFGWRDRRRPSIKKGERLPLIPLLFTTVIFVQKKVEGMGRMRCNTLK
jgi:hypothetical protein